LHTIVIMGENKQGQTPDLAMLAPATWGQVFNCNVQSAKIVVPDDNYFNDNFTLRETVKPWCNTDNHNHRFVVKKRGLKRECQIHPTFLAKIKAKVSRRCETSKKEPLLRIAGKQTRDSLAIQWG
jgi:hypothetical protein